MADRLIPPGATETYVEIGGARVRVLRGGPETAEPPRDEPLPIVLIHGGGYDHAGLSWFKVFGPLAAERVLIAPDLPGFGYTEGGPVTGDADDLADLVIAVARSCGLSRMVVVGISMGGDIALHLALHLALRRPTALAGLVLVAPGGLADRLGSGPVQLGAWLATRLPDPVFFGLGRLAGRFSGAYLRRMVADPGTVDEPLRRELDRQARRPGSGVGYGRYNQVTIGPRRMRNNLLPEVSRIATPTLLLHGESDRLVDPRGSLLAAAAMPRAGLVVVGRCGHWLPIEAPEAFLAVIGGFLAGLR